MQRRTYKRPELPGTRYWLQPMNSRRAPEHKGLFSGEYKLESLQTHVFQLFFKTSLSPRESLDMPPNHIFFLITHPRNFNAINTAYLFIYYTWVYICTLYIRRGSFLNAHPLIFTPGTAISLSRMGAPGEEPRA